MLNMEQTDISFFVLDGQIKHNLGQNQHAPEVAWGQRTCQQYQYYVDCMTWNTALSSYLLWFPVCLLSGNFSIAYMQFPQMKVKIAIDALECSNSNFPNFLLVQLSSAPHYQSGPPHPPSTRRVHEGHQWQGNRGNNSPWPHLCSVFQATWLSSSGKRPSRKRTGSPLPASSR